MDAATESFVTIAPRLQLVAQRILGSYAEAEDVVQDAWIRWQTCDRDQVRDPVGFLVATTKRLAINAAQSARLRRVVTVSEWSPEPVSSLDVGASAELYEELELAMGHLFERLSAPERSAFILRRGFSYPYPLIAKILGRSEVSTRQLVSRAGQRLGVDGASRADQPSQDLAKAIRSASERGTTELLQRVLAA